MVQVQVRVCDVCGEVSKPTRQYRIQREDEAVVAVDLCNRHAAPLEAFLKESGEPGVLPPPTGGQGASSAPPRPAKRAARRKGRVKVTTLEEIEASKQQE